MNEVAKLVAVLLLAFHLPVQEADGSSRDPLQVVYASEIIEKISKGEPVEYDHVIVEGDLDFSKSDMPINNSNSASNEIKFVYLSKSPVNIYPFIRLNDSIFNGYVKFDNSFFCSNIMFSGSNFTGNVSFSETIFMGNVEFSGSTFGGVISFWDTEFRRDAEFSGATFLKDADFSGATFGGVANFWEVEFNRNAEFSGATFLKDADFSGATFGGVANFWNSEFESNAEFSGTKFLKRVEFYGTTFGGDAHFNGAEFLGYISLWKWVRFRGNVVFNDTTFSSYADFYRSTFEDHADFVQAQFSSDCEFSGTRFEKRANFNRILFKKQAYFEDSYIDLINLTRADYGRLYLHWISIKSLDYDEGAYLFLIKNYKNLGWYNDANRCYYDYRNAVRKNWLTSNAAILRTRNPNRANWFIDTIQLILYGFGMKPLFPIIWSGFLVLSFGLFFLQKNCLLKLINEKRIIDSGEESSDVAIEIMKRKAQIRYLDAFHFSLLTFTSGFTIFLQPSVEYELTSHTRWAIIERLLGSLFIALFITAIGKTYLIR
jgi:uncharacterized protein YjbI with pentapeptide repeats